ncbi:hypothetical protein RFI_29221, partial [Reticulomyxa filosa]
LIYFKPLKVFQAHSASVNSIQFSPDETKIVSSSDDGTIKIWDVASGKEIQELRGHLDGVIDAKFSSDGSMIVSCSRDKSIRLWSMKSCTEIGKMESDTYVKSASFTSDGRIVLFDFWNNTMGIWDMQSEKESDRLQKHSNYANALHSFLNIQAMPSVDDCTIRKYFPDGQTIVLCSNNKTIQLWDEKLDTEKQKLIGHTDIITGVDIS